MKPLLTILMALLVPLQLASQTSRLRHRLAKADSLLSVRYYRQGYDTNYIFRPPGKAMLRLVYNLSGAVLEAESHYSVEPYRSYAEADYKGTLSAALTYKGVTLSMALNPGALIGKYKDYEFNLNSYGNKFGFDIIYQYARNFKGWLKRSDEPRIDIPTDLLSLKTLNLNGYYVFSHRRFSFPAAFSQTFMQRRSAGSWMLAASYQGQYLKIRPDDQLGNKSVSLQVANLGIGGGYGHNFVLPHKWLLHLSFMPTLIVASSTHMTLDDAKEELHYRFPEVIVTGRTALVHYWQRTFIGATGVVTFTNIGSPRHLEVRNVKWRFRTFWGIRL